jgi:glycosyltransferase involved in cell wall biosynthesis
MKIVIDARDAQLSRVGVAVYCSNIISQFELIAGDRHEFVFLTSNALPAPNVSGTILSTAPSAKENIFLKLKWYYQLPKLLRNLKADLYFGNFIPLPLQEDFPCAVVTTAHDAASISTSSLVGNSLSRYRNKYFVNGWVKKATHIICISEYCKQEFTEIFGEGFAKKASIVHHGLPNEFQNRKYPDVRRIEELKSKLTNGKDYLFSLGTVTPKKNYERLIEAFSEIENKEIHLLICGAYGFGADEILNVPIKYNVTDRVQFLNTLDTATVYELMCGANSFVFPSLYEGFGIPLLEAFSVGIPIACSNATCLPEIAGNAAIYFNPYVSQEITIAINAILSDENIRVRLVANGRERVKNFTWKKSAQEHLTTFENIVQMS